MDKLSVNIHYPFVRGPWGGSNSFLSALRDYLKGQPGVKLTDSSPDVILINSWAVRKFEIGKSKVVHRLDGIGRNYGRPENGDDEKQLLMNQISDVSVVQSRFSKKQFLDNGVKLTPTTVIHNGVDQSVFNPRGAKRWDGERPFVLGAVSWSANPNKGHHVISGFSAYPSVRVRFVGNWAAGVEANKVEMFSPVASRELPDFYRSCDALLFPAGNESCPNVVLEAISCGLPVIYNPSGGTPEIAKKYGVAFTGDIPRTIYEMFERYDELRANVYSGFREFSIRNAGERYLELFGSICRN